MRILLKNARILTMEEGKDIFRGDLLVEGNRIVEVKESIEADADRVIDCDGNLLMPGFKNAHSHSGMSFARSYADDHELQSWLFDVIFPMEDKLEPGDQYILNKISMLECLSSGITAIFDMYYTTGEAEASAKDIGIRTVILGTISSDIAYVEEMKQDYLRINAEDGLCSYQIGFHAEYTAWNEAIIDRLAEISHELKAPVYTHMAETKKEVEECKGRRDGLTPAAWMEKKGLLDHGGGIFHGVHLSEEDIDILARHNVSVVSCPGSNAKLASGIAPLDALDKAGINIGIGTDGPASNNALDMFYEMRLMTVLQKLKDNDSTAYPASKVLRAATVNSAKAMGLHDCLYLAKGQKADIIMIDLMRPSLQPIHNIEDSLVYAGGKDCVKMTMVDGIIRYMDGKFYIDEELSSIYPKAESITKRLTSK